MSEKPPKRFSADSFKGTPAEDAGLPPFVDHSAPTSSEGWASIPKETKEEYPGPAPSGPSEIPKENRDQLREAVSEFVDYQEVHAPPSFEGMRGADLHAYTAETPSDSTDNRGVGHWTGSSPAKRSWDLAEDFSKIKETVLPKFDAAAKEAIEDSFIKKPRRESREKRKAAAIDLAPAKESYAAARDEYLAAYKKFHADKNAVQRWATEKIAKVKTGAPTERSRDAQEAARKQIGSLEELKKKSVDARISYADTMEKSVRDRLKAQGKSDDYIEKALGRYRGVIRYNELVRPDREAQIKARAEALGDKGLLFHEKVIKTLGSINRYLEENLGKSGAMVARALGTTTVMTLGATAGAAALGTLGSSALVFAAGYGGIRLMRSLTSIVAGTAAGGAVGKIAGWRARITQNRAKEKLAAFSAQDRRGAFTYDSLVANDGMFAKLMRDADDATVAKKKAIAQAITAFLVGAGVNVGISLYEGAGSATSAGLDHAGHPGHASTPPSAGHAHHPAAPGHPAHPQPGVHAPGGQHPQAPDDGIRPHAKPPFAEKGGHAAHTHHERQSIHHHERRHAGALSDAAERERIETKWLNDWQLTHPGDLHPPRGQMEAYIAQQLALEHASTVHAGISTHAAPQDHADSILPRPKPELPPDAMPQDVPPPAPAASAPIDSYSPDSHSPGAVPLDTHPIRVDTPPPDIDTSAAHASDSLPDQAASAIPAPETLSDSAREAIQANHALSVSDALYGTGNAGHGLALDADAHRYLIAQIQQSGLGPNTNESLADYLHRVTQSPFRGGTHLYKDADGKPYISGGDFNAQRAIAYEYLMSRPPNSAVFVPSPDGKSTWIAWVDGKRNVLDVPATADGLPMEQAIGSRGFFGRIGGMLFGTKPDAMPPINPSALTRVQ